MESVQLYRIGSPVRTGSDFLTFIGFKQTKILTKKRQVKRASVIIVRVIISNVIIASVII